MVFLAQGLLDSFLIPKASNSEESRDFYLGMRGEFEGHLAEFSASTADEEGEGELVRLRSDLEELQEKYESVLEQNRLLQEKAETLRILTSCKGPERAVLSNQLKVCDETVWESLLLLLLQV